MPLIPIVGRKSPKMRLVIGSIYLILVVGAVTMVYPFLLMFSNSLTSEADWEEFRVVPRYFFNRRELFKKYIVDKAGVQGLRESWGRDGWHAVQDIVTKVSELERMSVSGEMLAATCEEFGIPPRTGETFERPFRVEFSSKEGSTRYRITELREETAEVGVYETRHRIDVTRPSFLSMVEGYDLDGRKAVVGDWKEFLEVRKERLERFRFMYFTHFSGTHYNHFSMRREFAYWVHDKYERNLQEINLRYNSASTNPEFISTPFHLVSHRRWLLEYSHPRVKDWLEFLDERSGCHNVHLYSLDEFLYSHLRREFQNVDELNSEWGTSFESFGEITFSEAMGVGAFRDASRGEFLRTKAPLMFVELAGAEEEYRDFLEERFAKLSPEERSRMLERLPHSKTRPRTQAALSHWADFLERGCPDELVKAAGPALMWREFLREKYGPLEALNQAHRSAWKSFRRVRLPYPLIDYDYFSANRWRIFRTYLTGNYRAVLRYMAVNGYALRNTIIYVILSITIALTVNPLAAYALSRYRLPYTNKILIFLLATMAFPAEVTMIPNFLMIKQLGMLNTFLALVVPGMANGYMIFLLKGFFDSLPPELYEAGLLDGASELTMFWRITIPLSKPILAVVALRAFTRAYGAFMFAFLTCQDPKMWTLMVFLYQFQQEHANYMVMASLVISAVPTLLVFIFCQNIILRGIVIPTFK